MGTNQNFIREDMKALLAGLAEVGRPALAELTLEDARASYLALHQMTDAPARELKTIRDLTCPGPAGDIPLRLYDARDAREPGPVICYFHGGGFVIGDLETHHNLCTEIAAKMDLPVVAVDYRRAPEHKFPAAVDDCEAAARWIASAPEALGRTPTGLIPMGDSAGGNAAIVTTQALGANPATVPVVLQVPIFPLAGEADKLESLEKFDDGFVLTKAAVEWFDEQYAPERGNPRAFPIHADHAGTPPTVLITASLDPIRDSGRDYGAALAKAGVSHVFLEMHGLTHSFVNLRAAVPSTQADLDRVFAAMRMMLDCADPQR